MQGVVAWSSGNHAQGVAEAASLLGIKSTIVMPSDAPTIKIENTRRLGGSIVFYDREREDRERIAKRIVKNSGATLVPSYDDYEIIAGQGTVGLEIIDDLEAQNTKVDVLLCCCGGGGLISGVSTALAALSPHTKIYAVEPENFDDTQRSLKAGLRLKNAPRDGSICDALLAPAPGKLTFPIMKSKVHSGLTVSDHEVLLAMSFGFQHLKLVIEPGGAVALAALLSKKIDLSGKNVAVVVSGGNVDNEIFKKALSI